MPTLPSCAKLEKQRNSDCPDQFMGDYYHHKQRKFKMQCFGIFISNTVYQILEVAKLARLAI